MRSDRRSVEGESHDRGQGVRDTQKTRTQGKRQKKYARGEGWVREEGRGGRGMRNGGTGTDRWGGLDGIIACNSVWLS